MFHESHSTVFRPTLSIVVSDHILVVRVRILSKIPLNELSSFVAGEFEENIKMIDIPEIDSNGMSGLNFDRLEYHELIFISSRSCNLVSSIETHDKNIDDESIELEDERSELQTHKQSIIVSMIHVFKVDNHVILSRHVVSNVMIDYQSKQSIQQCQINFLVYLVKSSLKKNQRLVL